MINRAASTNVDCSANSSIGIPRYRRDALFSIDKRDGALTGTRVPVAAIESNQTGLIAKFANVDRALAGGAFNEGQ